ncbi:mechanosensitive ion channel family protein [Parvularcula sp. IMCC14364]|uniref:mechanosensitive ion channel family protein n=1 Tax=Parvularcula sp. IMCC14364 TaxID=3067902 RepID=UPI002741C59D|nr:mechanosensitive ion channel domain-containing protein [Parvularcula sp. IMCC14364]
MQENTGDAANMSSENVQVLMNTLAEKAAEWGMSAVSALIILIIGLFVAGRIKSAIRKVMTRTGKLDAMLIGFISSLVYYAALALVLVMVLGSFGVQTTSLAAVIGAAGLAIGLALQGTLGHVASGVMLLAFRPFKIGDYVEAGGEAGTIKDITIFTTEMATVDNKKIIIPNGKIWDDTITNYSANTDRRLDMVFGISYDDDIGKARDIILQIIKDDERVQDTPAPLVEVNSLGDFSVDFTVRMWLKGSDYFAVKWDMNRKIKEAFDAQGVNIPFPTTIEIQKQG